MHDIQYVMYQVHPTPGCTPRAGSSDFGDAYRIQDTAYIIRYCAQSAWTEASLPSISSPLLPHVDALACRRPSAGARGSAAAGSTVWLEFELELELGEQLDPWPLVLGVRCVVPDT